MSPYREHQIERPESWRLKVFGFLADALDGAWPYALAGALVTVGVYALVCFGDAVEASRLEQRTALTNEARSWSTSVGFQVVGVYCYGDAVCDVSVGSAESMRVLYLHCVPGEGCVPR